MANEKTETKPRDRVRVWPQTLLKLERIAKENKRKVNATIDQLADEYLERNSRRRAKQTA